MQPQVYEVAELVQIVVRDPLIPQVLYPCILMSVHYLNCVPCPSKNRAIFGI